LNAGRRRGLLGPAVAALAAFAVLIGLGIWQLERKAWKEGLIDTIGRKLAAPPVALPPAADWARLDQGGPIGTPGLTRWGTVPGRTTDPGVTTCSDPSSARRTRWSDVLWRGCGTFTISLPRLATLMVSATRSFSANRWRERREPWLALMAALQK